MALGLHPECQRRLADAIAGCLPELLLQNRRFLQMESTGCLKSLDDILPKTGDIRSRVEQYVSEEPVSDFLIGTLSRELYTSQEFDGETPTMRLIDLDNYRDPASTSRRLVEQLESLPWKYVFSFNLGSDLSQSLRTCMKTVRLADNGWYG